MIPILPVDLAVVRPRDAAGALLILGLATRATPFRTTPTRARERRAFDSDFRAADRDAVWRIYDG